VLQFLLDERPTGFPLNPMPLWQLVCDYILLHNIDSFGPNSPTPAAAIPNAKLPPLPVSLLSPMLDILALNQAYMGHFAPSAPREGQAAEPVLPSGSFRRLSPHKAMVDTLVNTRYSILLLLSSKSSVKTTEPYLKQLKEQLWLSPALVDASLAQLAAWCQHHYLQHSHKQEQGKGKEPGEVCKQKQKLQKQGGTSSSKKSSGSGSPEVGSGSKKSSSSSSKVDAFKFASASSWSDLKVLPDHEQVAVAGGQAAVAAHLGRLTQVHKRLNLGELPLEVLPAAILLERSLLPGVGLQEGEKEPLPGDVRLSRRPAATITALQLALQGVACKGLQVEAALAGVRESGDSSMRRNSVWQAGKSPSSALGMDAMIQLLYTQFAAADGATRGAFVAARGGYALQVMWLVLKVAMEQQQHQPHQQEVSEVAALVAGTMLQLFRGPDGDKIRSERSELQKGGVYARCNACDSKIGNRA
jgi:hypothetical protein